VLDLAGAPADFPVHGRSLAAAPEAGRAILYELLALRYYRTSDGGAQPRGWRWWGVREGDHKLLARAPEPAGEGSAALAQLFDVRADPREQNDLAGREPRRRAALERRFAAEQARARQDAARYRRGGEAALTPAEEEQLRALGYLAP
jgi:hypothetical protein